VRHAQLHAAQKITGVGLTKVKVLVNGKQHPEKETEQIQKS